MRQRLGCIGLIVLTGCAAVPASKPMLAPPQIAAAQADEASNGLTQALVQGQLLVVTLPSNPSTGYRWRWRIEGQPVVQPDGDPAFAVSVDTDRVGAAGNERWLLRAQQAGQGRLVFEYYRPWEQGLPLRELVFPVQVRG